MEGEDEQGNKARETPQSVDTLLKRLELSLLPSQRDAAPLDFSDIDMVCKNPRGKLPKTWLVGMTYLELKGHTVNRA